MIVQDYAGHVRIVHTNQVLVVRHQMVAVVRQLVVAGLELNKVPLYWRAVVELAALMTRWASHYWLYHSCTMVPVSKLFVQQSVVIRLAASAGLLPHPIQQTITVLLIWSHHLLSCTLYSLAYPHQS